MTVWLLWRDDGNVCCPGPEFVGVFSNESIARVAMGSLIANRGKYDTTNYWIDETVVDSYKMETS